VTDTPKRPTSKPAPQVPGLPRALPDFIHINRYWDRLHDTFAAKILPGECYVTAADEAIVTVLGSCVSACVRDRRLRIGGMNHFMLPEGGADRATSPVILSSASRYGNFAMELLINAILRHGGRREHLEVKIFGGARVLRSVTDIGQRNIAFAREYLSLEGLDLQSEDVGGPFPRKLYYFPATGRARIKKLRRLQNRTMLEREDRYRRQIEQTPVQGDVELF